MNVELTGRLTVARPPAEAFTFFTARGEQGWAPGWQPRFPAPTPDDTVPGTVFETDARGRTTTWVVVERTPGRRIRYARVAPGDTAGTVTVDLTDATERAGHSDVTVTYALTALTPSAIGPLRGFAARYPQMLRDWETAIATSREQAVNPRT